MSSYKLTYFYPGEKAGLARLQFFVSGTNYTDDKVAKPAPTGCPISQFPLLQVDGVSSQQNTAYNRLLAKRFNLAGANDLEALAADSVVEVLDQLEACYSANILRLKDAAAQKEARKAFLNGAFKKFLVILDRLVGANGKNGFSSGAGLTWADLYLHLFAQDLPRYDPGVFSAYPNLDKAIKTIAAHPKVAAFPKAQ